MRDLARHPEIWSINTATLGFQSPIDDVIEALARAGFSFIAPWRREIEGQDVEKIARHMREAGLKVSGYCRSTYLPARTAAEFKVNIAANRRAIDDASILRASSFVLVVGGLPAGSRDISSARAQVVEGIALLLDHARATGVRLALEPLHPVYAAERSCITLLSEALDLCDAIEGETMDPWLGTLIDVYHVWWDVNLARDVRRAGKAKRIFGFHVCDWLVPTRDVLNDRGMMGDGVIDVPAIRRMVEDAGYHGPVEVEIFSAENWWRKPPEETLKVCRERLQSAT